MFKFFDSLQYVQFYEKNIYFAQINLSKLCLSI